MSFKSFMTDLINDKKKCVIVISLAMAIIVAVCVLIAVLLTGAPKDPHILDHNSSTSAGDGSSAGETSADLPAYVDSSADGSSACLLYTSRCV